MKKPLSLLQKQIYKSLLKGDISLQELANEVGKPINTISKAIYILRKKGWLVKCVTPTIYSAVYVGPIISSPKPQKPLNPLQHTTFNLLLRGGLKGIYLHELAEKVGVEENKIVKIIIRIRRKGWPVKQVSFRSFSADPNATNLPRPTTV